MAYTKEEKYELRYEVPTANGNWSEKVAFGNSKEWLDRNKAKCKELGYRVVKASKLYPFNTWKNQHNFMLISNICRNTISDMEMGEKEWDDAEIERLEALREKADKLESLPLPLAWIPYEDWKDAKELSEMASLHRYNTCLEHGRYRDLQYC